MDLAALRLAADLGGTLVAGSGPEHRILLVERLAGHGLPTVLVVGASPEDLRDPLAAISSLHREGLALGLAALLPLGGCDLRGALACHRRRIGSLLGAVDAGLPWLEGRPMLAKRLPGRVRAPAPQDLEPAFLGPLEWRELRAFLPHWSEERIDRTFRNPAWTREGDQWTAPLWPGVGLPPGAQVLALPLELPTATPFSEAFRSALRALSAGPVPWLPLPEDPSVLGTLGILTPHRLAFRGPQRAWELALAKLARLPAPPHFCARC